MGWYVRKSFRMGPVRWNLSKSGIGVSVGVRGLRVGTGPRGSYIAGGRRGLYFRQPLGQPSAPKRVASPLNAPPVPSPSAAPVQYLPQTQVGAFTPTSADALARYITAQRAHIPLVWWAAGSFAVLNLVIFGVLWPSVLWPLVFLTSVASIYGVYLVKQWDRRRTHVLLHYDLDPAEQASYQQLCAGLQALAATARLAQVDAQQFHGDWKHNAGATTDVLLSPAAVLPPGSLTWLEMNVPVWSLRWRQGHLSLIFLPDRLLVEQGRLTASVFYGQVQVSMTLSRFIERLGVPPDARIVAYTWQYTNKDGSPDRRFKNNYQLPVTEVAYVGFQGAAGLNLVLQASNRDKVGAFVQSIHAFRPLVCAAPPFVP